MVNSIYSYSKSVTSDMYPGLLIRPVFYLPPRAFSNNPAYKEGAPIALFKKINDGYLLGIEDYGLYLMAHPYQYVPSFVQFKINDLFKFNFKDYMYPTFIAEFLETYLEE